MNLDKGVVMLGWVGLACTACGCASGRILTPDPDLEWLSTVRVLCLALALLPAIGFWLTMREGRKEAVGRIRRCSVRLLTR